MMSPRKKQQHVPMSVTAAAVYSRVSTDEQVREGVSLQAQEARGRAYCELHGLSLERVYRDEAVSGSKPLAERPQGSQLCADVRAGAVRHVIALKLDRLFRDAIDCLEVSREWETAGVAMHLIDLGGQAVNSASAMGRFMITVLAGAAEMERNLIRERTRLALQHKRERGDRLGGTPFGFVPSSPMKPLVGIQGELETVRLILQLRRRDPERWTFRAIAEKLERDGHRTQKGGRWEAMTVKRVWDRRDMYRACASL
jgi:site-specific DNA recombinase